MEHEGDGDTNCNCHLPLEQFPKTVTQIPVKDHQLKLARKTPTIIIIIYKIFCT